MGFACRLAQVRQDITNKGADAVHQPFFIQVLPDSPENINEPFEGNTKAVRLSAETTITPRRSGLLPVDFR